MKLIVPCIWNLKKNSKNSLGPVPPLLIHAHSGGTGIRKLVDQIRLFNRSKGNLLYLYVGKDKVMLMCHFFTSHSHHLFALSLALDGLDRVVCAR